MAAARDAIAAIAALGTYKAAVIPRVQREPEDLRQVAAAIPDPDRRKQAITALVEKRLSVEATAAGA